MVRRRIADISRRPAPFALRVLQGFIANRGLLLAGAVAYNSLLSIIPLFGVILLALSFFVDDAQLITTIEAHLSLIVPGSSSGVTEQVETLLAERGTVTWVVALLLLFFSSIAFGVLESAMGAIFHHRPRRERGFLMSAVLPYVFIALLGVGVLLISLISGAIERIDGNAVHLFGAMWTMEGASAVVLYGLGMVGLVAMLTAFYLVMPVGKIRVRHAFVGGLVAAVLWEIARHVLTWYFETLSLVHVVYGPLAGAVVALLSFEIGAIILLFGAQVIAEFDRHQPAGGDADHAAP
ncbi:MAG: YihY/virulence factor BrkB family protein [Deltaproteobacteria bacterium]|nr:YihY/virulence factor BrkB family protein [Deltaproteobacteria bacterium]